MLVCLKGMVCKLIFSCAKHNLIRGDTLIIKQVKNRGKTSSATKGLLDYLVSDGKQVGYQREYPKGVGKDLIYSESKNREGSSCYLHIITSVRFDENPTPETWAFSEEQIKSVLSLENHPHFSATHYETDYHHMHTVIGTVDMKTGVRKDPWASYHKLGQARKVIESNFGLSVSNPNNRGLYSRGFGGAKPKWDEEYIRQKKMIERKISDLAANSTSWAEVQLQLEKYHRLVLLLEKKRRKELAIYDQVNRWVFDEFEEDFASQFETTLGRFPFERVSSVKEYLSEQEHGSLRPRAVTGIDMVNLDVSQASEVISSKYPRSRIARSKKGIMNYGDSLSVSLIEHGAGRACVYSNGVEPYSAEHSDQTCANLLARILIDGTDAQIKKGYVIDERLIKEFSGVETRIKR